MPISLYFVRTVNNNIKIDAVTIGNEKYNLVEFEKPKSGNFLQLETFCKDKTFARVVHIVQFDSVKPQLKLGRGHDVDLKIGDISVSRIHAMITLTPKGFVLQDNASKFGTLILLPPEPQKIPSSGLFIQVNRTTLGLTLKPNENSASKGFGTCANIMDLTQNTSIGSPSLYFLKNNLYL